MLRPVWAAARPSHAAICAELGPSGGLWWAEVPAHGGAPEGLSNLAEIS